jgi:hypothetical protein
MSGVCSTNPVDCLLVRLPRNVMNSLFYPGSESKCGDDIRPKPSNFTRPVEFTRKVTHVTFLFAVGKVPSDDQSQMITTTSTQKFAFDEAEGNPSG